MNAWELNHHPAEDRRPIMPCKPEKCHDASRGLSTTGNAVCTSLEVLAISTSRACKCVAL